MFKIPFAHSYVHAYIRRGNNARGQPYRMCAICDCKVNANEPTKDERYSGVCLKIGLPLVIESISAAGS